MKLWIIWQYVKTIAVTAVAGVVIWYISDDSILPFYAGIFLKIVGAFIVLSGILLAVLKDIKSRIYRCDKCQCKFTPDVATFKLLSKKQICPKCGSESSLDGRETRL